MMTIDNTNILDNKDQLINPKASDTFCLDINLNHGQRFYDISIGRKWVYFRPLFSVGTIKKSRVKAQELLSVKYWRAAESDAHYKYCTGDSNRKTLPKNWISEY